MSQPAPNTIPLAGDESTSVPLDALARHHGASRLPIATAMYLGAGLARAVAAAHDRGQVLGTLDANRVRCTRDGEIVIAPEGGSFMAPETRRGEAPDILSDIYAVGAIVYRLLTGMTPLQAMTHQPVSRLHEVPAPSALIPGVDPTLDDVLLSALASDPGERPISARVLSATIDAIFTELEVIASPSGVVRAVAATNSRRMGPPKLYPSFEKTSPHLHLPATQTLTGTEGEGITTDIGSVIVSPSILAPSLAEAEPTVTLVTSTDAAVAEPTRELKPLVGPDPRETVVERTSKLRRPAEADPRMAELTSRIKRPEGLETESQNTVPPTSLIYGHPFFRKQEDFMDEREEVISDEATDDVMPFAESLARARRATRFAGEVWADARSRLSRRWSRLSPESQRWAAVAFAGSVAVVLLAGLLFGRSHGRAESSVEVVGEPTIAVQKSAPPPARVAAAPEPAPVPSSINPSVVVKSTPLAQATPAAPQARPAVKASAPAPKLTRAEAAKKAKLSKKALAKKKAAAKRAAARRHAR